MGDSYRPDRHRRSYYDSDKPDNPRASRGRSAYGDEYRGDVPRAPSPTLNYEARDDPNDHYRLKVWHPQYTNYTRSDDLRYNKQMPRHYDGRVVAQVPEGCPPETGENDISRNDVPLKLVLVRGLHTKVDENVFAKGMEKFYTGSDDIPGGAEAKSLRRVLLIRERKSDQSMGYGFAEYHTLDDAKAAVRKESELKKVKRCTIRSCEISLCFPHMGVFPHADYGVPEYRDEYTITMPGTDHRHRYRDQRYYASELFVNTDSARATNTVAQKDSTEGKKSTKIGDKRKLETLESKTKRVKGPLSAAPPHLQLWQSKSAELRGEADTTALETSKQPASGINTITAAISASETTDDEQTFAYDGEIVEADGKITNVICCYLCLRAFETKKQVLNHLERSTLHPSNLKDSSAISKGYQRLTNKGIDPEKTIRLSKVPSTDRAAAPAFDTQEVTANYRDRAAERRQEEIKTTGSSLKSANLKKTGGNVSGSSSDNEPSEPTYGKGKNLLEKVGWSEGEGLGAGGGITAPIEQSLYASGVGLGHESSKKGDAVEEASRMTRNDRGEFLEKTRELAKKRYEDMK